MYSKKTVILKQYNNRFALNGQISGVLTMLGDGANAKCTLTLRNIDHHQYGLWRIAVCADNKVTMAEVTNLDCFRFTAQSGKLKHVTVVVCMQQEVLHTVAYGGDCLGVDTALIAQLQPNNQQTPTNNTSEESTKYEQFVLATGNYYDSQEGQRLLSGYKKVMDEFYTTQGGNFYASVKGRLLALFDVYPRSQLLMKAIDNSLFVKVDRKKGHFCLGLLIEKGAPRYICYALPLETSQAPQTALDYCYIFQDAATGELSSRSF